MRPRNQYKPIGAENLREIEAIPLVRTNQKSLRKIHKCPDSRRELPTSLISFGPVYFEDDSSESAKEEAWKQVLRKSRAEDEENRNKENRNKDEENRNKDAETTDVYLSVIRTVEKKARAAYADEALDNFTESQFRWRMIKDGCFFLQLALFILGVSKELGYPENHIIFGKKHEKKNVFGWINSMFYAGNQIPLVVLNELMKQAFFQKVIKDHGEWKIPTDMLSKRVLYDLLIQPSLGDANNGASQAPGSTCLSEDQHSDLLHGLQNLLLGQKVSKDGSDEEEEDEEEGDLEAGKKLNTVEVDGDNDGKQRCISGFRKKGIHFWKSNGTGIREIRFQNYILYAGLYLPTIRLNRETIMLFKNLNYYEECQQQNEIRSYLGLMNQLISTYEDVNHLASKGIFDIKKPQYKEEFLRMLKDLPLPKTATINHEHRCVLQQLRDYSSFPWEYFKYVAIIAFILAVLQTIFGVLSYVVGLKQLHGSKA